MVWEVRRIAKNTRPLCYMPNGNLVGYNNGDLVIFDKKTHKEVERFAVIKDIREVLFYRIKYVSRLLRLGVRSAIALDDHTIILSIHNVIYEYDLNTQKLSSGFVLPKGTRPLRFSDVKGISTFEDGIYFGEYMINMQKAPVSIIKRNKCDKWDVVYKFESGLINHVHNIVGDSYRNLLWVLTGDFGEAAAIWKISDNFKKIERFAYNNQKCRSCVAFALKDGMIYATDTPFTDNFVYIVRNFSKMQANEILPISGSCIYGSKTGDKFVFSSTVEGGVKENKGILGLLFGKNRGAGIKDNYTHLYIGDTENGFLDVYKAEKDFLPFLFQFATITFPEGNGQNNTIYFQPIATKQNDMDLMLCEWKK